MQQKKPIDGQETDYYNKDYTLGMLKRSVSEI